MMGEWKRALHPLPQALSIRTAIRRTSGRGRAATPYHWGIELEPDRQIKIQQSSIINRQSEAETNPVEVDKTEFDRDVIAVEFSPDGRYLAAHDDTTVRI
jgi:hypothetical protein